jgi:hypothetical protein
MKNSVKMKRFVLKNGVFELKSADLHEKYVFYM